MTGDDSFTAVLLTIIGTLGSSGAIALIIKGGFDHLMGRAAAERARDADALEQRNHAWERMRSTELELDKAIADEAASRGEAWRAIEYAAQLRAILREAGITPPDWPEGTL